MSAGPQLDSGSGGSTGGSSDCRVRLTIDGTDIPNTQIETHHSRDGVADRNTFTTAVVPTSWKGEDITSQITAFSASDGSQNYSQATVEWQDAMTSKWVTVHQGYVRAVGGGPKTGTAKVMIGGWEQFFTAIPFTKSYSRPTVTAVLNDVVSKVSQYTPVSLGVVGGGSTQVSSPSAGQARVGSTTTPGLGGAVAILDFIGNIVNQDLVHEAPPDKTLNVSKSFRKNRHTLKDVMKWVTGQVDARWYIDTTGNEPALVLDQNLTHRHWKDASLGSPGVRVIDNDAIQEIVPVNALTANGKSSMSIAGFRIKELDSNEFPTATVQYDPLIAAAGGQLRKPIVDADTLTVTATENRAKRELRERLKGASGGDITMYGKPDIEPFDRFTGVPVCNSHHVGDVPPIDYEVTEVQHKKTGGNEYGTRIGVNIWVDPDKISITHSTMETM